MANNSILGSNIKNIFFRLRRDNIIGQNEHWGYLNNLIQVGAIKDPPDWPWTTSENSQNRPKTWSEALDNFLHPDLRRRKNPLRVLLDRASASQALFSFEALAFYSKILTESEKEEIVNFTEKCSQLKIQNPVIQKPKSPDPVIEIIDLSEEVEPADEFYLGKDFRTFENLPESPQSLEKDSPKFKCDQCEVLDESMDEEEFENHKLLWHDEKFKPEECQKVSIFTEPWLYVFVGFETEVAMGWDF